MWVAFFRSLASGLRCARGSPLHPAYTTAHHRLNVVAPYPALRCPSLASCVRRPGRALQHASATPKAAVASRTQGESKRICPNRKNHALWTHSSCLLPKLRLAVGMCLLAKWTCQRAGLACGLRVKNSARSASVCLGLEKKKPVLHGWCKSDFNSSVCIASGRMREKHTIHQPEIASQCARKEVQLCASICVRHGTHSLGESHPTSPRPIACSEERAISGGVRAPAHTFAVGFGSREVPLWRPRSAAPTTPTAYNTHRHTHSHPSW
jgi:hypothetical protein